MNALKTDLASLPLAVSLLLFGFAGTTFAQASALVVRLEPGPYAVGFRSVNQYDYSRSYKLEYDLEGNPATGEQARPIQTSVWYPARSERRARTMRFAEYAYLLANEENFVELTEAARSEAIKQLQVTYGTPPDRLSRELGAATNAIKNAAPAAGAFPVLVYAPGFNGPSFENSVLCEYLASQGYIVVASPCLGINSRRTTTNMAGIEAQTRDIEFLISFAHTLPHADLDRLAVIGFSMGGISNVYATMRDDRIKALVGLDGAIRFQDAYNMIKQAPHFDVGKVNVPFFYMSSKPYTAQDSEFPFYKALRYSDAYYLTFNKLVHLNFASAVLKLSERESDEASQEEINQSYELVCRYTLAFLNAYLKGDEKSLGHLRQEPEATRPPASVLSAQSKAAFRPSPVVGEFAHFLRSNAVTLEDADKEYEKIKQNNPDYTLAEAEVNSWGYELLRRKKVREAVGVFKLNVRMHPQSAGVYDSLAEAYMEQGDKELAVQNYKRSLELNPQNSNALEMIKKLSER